MAITEVAAGRMAPLTALPSRSFGIRSRPPSLPAPPSDPHPAKQWCQALLSRLQPAKPWVQALLSCLHPAEPWAEALRSRLKAGLRRLRPSAAGTRKAAIHAVLYDDFRTTFPRLLAYLGALALLAGGVLEISRSGPVAAAMQPVPQPEWVAVSKPLPAFALSMPELAQAGVNYEIRRNSFGGGRKDIMTWGELSGEGPHLMVEVYRPGAEFLRFTDAPHEIAARTADRAPAKSIKPAEAIDSKFGPVSLVEFSTKADGSHRCLGFVRGFERPRMQIAGWYCAAGPELVERSTLTCALDRLTLLSAASDAKVGELFARAELKRNFCGQRSVLLTPTPKHGPSPAQAAESKLRGRLSAR